MERYYLDLMKIVLKAIGGWFLINFNLVDAGEKCAIEKNYESFILTQLKLAQLSPTESASTPYLKRTRIVLYYEEKGKRA